MSNQSVEQSGNVTPGHAATWTYDGVIEDGGPFLSPVNATLTNPTINGGTITGAALIDVALTGYSFADPTITGGTVNGVATDRFVYDFISIAALRANLVAASGYVFVATYHGLATPLDSYGGGFFEYVASDTTSADNGFTIIVDSGGNRWYRLFLGAAINPQMAGAYGDGVNVDSVPIQKCIDYLNSIGGGVLWHPALSQDYLANVSLKTGVALTSDWPFQGDLDGNVSAVTYKKAANGFVIDTPASATYNCGVSGININGQHTLYSGGGIRFQNVSRGFMLKMHVEYTYDQAYLTVAGLGNAYDNLLCTNCLYNNSYIAGATKVANFQLDGTDHFVGPNMEISGQAFAPGTVTGAAMNYPAVILGSVAGGPSSGNMFITDIVAEFGDVGLYINSPNNRFSNAQPGFNAGPAVLLDTSAAFNTFAAFSSVNNATAATATYPAIIDKGSGNAFGPMSFEQISTSHQFLNLIQNLTTGAGQFKRSVYGPMTFGNSGDAGLPFSGTIFDFTNANFDTPGVIEGNAPARFDSLTTPTVYNTGFALANAPGATNVTNFVGGYEGKKLTVLATTGNTTIVNGSGINTNTGANRTLVSGTVYTFVYHNGVWYEGSGN